MSNMDLFNNGVFKINLLTYFQIHGNLLRGINIVYTFLEGFIMKNLFFVGAVVFAITACGSKNNNSTDTSSNSNINEITNSVWVQKSENNYSLIAYKVVDNSIKTCVNIGYGHDPFIQSAPATLNGNNLSANDPETGTTITLTFDPSTKTMSGGGFVYNEASPYMTEILNKNGCGFTQDTTVTLPAGSYQNGDSCKNYTYWDGKLLSVYCKTRDDFYWFNNQFDTSKCSSGKLQNMNGYLQCV